MNVIFLDLLLMPPVVDVCTGLFLLLILPNEFCPVLKEFRPTRPAFKGTLTLHAHSLKISDPSSPLLKEI